MRIVADENMAAVADAFGPLGSVRMLPGRAITRDSLRDADVLLVRSVTRVGAALLDGTPVRFVGSATAGADHVDEPWLGSRGIAFAHAPGSNATAVAEYVVAALLELATGACAAHDRVARVAAAQDSAAQGGAARDRAARNPPAPPAVARLGFELRGRTIGVVGVGHVGSRVARLAEALGMTVIRNDPPLAGTTRDPVYRPLDELLEHADVVTLHVPLTREGPHATADLLNESRLARLRPGAILINTSRGEVVDETALKRIAGHFAAGAADAMGAEGAPDAAHPANFARLGGLVLDVWRNEPAVDPELVALADLATPHIAGYSDPAKLAGTLAVYEALCRWLGRPATWRLASNALVQLTPPLAAVPLERRLQLLVTQVCPVGNSSADFKSRVASAAPATRSDSGAPRDRIRQAFDAMRRQFRRRHEFADGALPETTDAELARAAAGLGFKPVS